MTTFDPVGGSAAKQDGMDRAERHANPDWWLFMLAAARDVALRKEAYNTDDLERIRQDRQGPRTHENRAMGPLMREAQRLGYCVPTQDWTPSSQRGNHRRPMMTWYSLIYQGAPTRRPRRRKILDPRQLSLLPEDDR